MKSKLIIGILLAGVFCFPAGYANTLNCTLSTLFHGETSVVNIAGTISVGEDAPVGTVLYKAFYRTVTPSGVTCLSKEPWPSVDEEIDIPFIMDATITPLPEILGLRDPNGGTIYQTNVAGIGVAIAYERYFKLPYSNVLSQVPESEDNVTGLRHKGNAMNVGVFLIKTGDFNAGTVNGTTFPTITTVFYTPTGSPQHTFNGFPIKTTQLNFSGQIQVVKNTCKIVTNNITVPLGKYDVSEFNGKGSTTEWKDASINLVGCASPMPGYYSNNNDSIERKGEGTFPLGIPDVSNRAVLRVYPSSGFIDGNKGIIRLKPSTFNAKGIGIQIGYDDSGTIKPLDLRTDKGLTLPANGATTMKVPLSARYMQTEDSVTGGTADGAITYTIIYY